MKKIAVVYHDADFDGLLSGEVCKHWIKRLWPDAELKMFGWDYGREVPSIFFPNKEAGDDGPTHFFPTDIYIVDLSVDELMTNELLRDRIVWIDHHKTAIDKYKDVPFKGYRIDGVAACRLAWVYFAEIEFNRRHQLDDGPRPEQMPDKKWFVDRKGRNGVEPYLLEVAGEYDVWDHRNSTAIPIQYGLKVLQAKPHHWEALIKSCFDPLDQRFGGGPMWMDIALEKGEAAMLFIQQQNNELIAKYAHDVKFLGLTFLCINSWRFNSQTFESGLKPHHDAMMGWTHVGNGQFKVSLYGRPERQDIDLSVIAANMGGGGHKHACGFTCGFNDIRLIVSGDFLSDKELAGCRTAS